MLSSPFLCPDVGQMPSDQPERQPEFENHTLHIAKDPHE